jgi:hypothetical protein
MEHYEKYKDVKHQVENMHTIEFNADVSGTHEINLKLPEHIKNKTVKVIIIYDEERENSHQEKQRQFGQFKESFFISDDFDDELPDSFWLGEDH